MKKWFDTYWQVTLQQQREEMKHFFHEDACIRWHNTNEQFTLMEYIDANCKYPGEWDGEVERCLPTKDGAITITHVYGMQVSFHVTSIFVIVNGKITNLDEYWSEDGEAPKWRQDLHIGIPIPKKEQRRKRARTIF